MKWGEEGGGGNQGVSLEKTVEAARPSAHGTGRFNVCGTRSHQNRYGQISQSPFMTFNLLTEPEQYSSLHKHNDTKAQIHPS